MFFNRRKENIRKSLKRLGATQKIYCIKDGKNPPPDDGKIYGQYTISVNNIIVRLYIDNKDEIKAIRAITEDEYFQPILKIDNEPLSLDY